MNHTDLEEITQKHDEEIKEIKRELDILRKLWSLIKDDKSTTDTDELKKQNARLLKELDKLKQSNNQLSNEIKNLQHTNAKLQKDLDQNTLQHLYKLFDSLDDNTKNNVKNILNNTNEKTLFASAILHIDPMWEYLKHLRVEHKDKEFEILYEVFEIVFQSYQAITDISYQQIQVGDNYDTQLHTRDNRSQEMDGTIKQIILKGLLKDTKIIKKSIVLL
jgi:anion-transporting  ArsA/GET3 family ATPase